MSESSKESMASMLCRITHEARGERPTHAWIWSTDAATLAGITDPNHPWIDAPEWIVLSEDGS